MDERNSTAEKYVYDAENNQLMNKVGDTYLPMTINSYTTDGSPVYLADTDGNGKRDNRVELHAAGDPFDKPCITYWSEVPVVNNGETYIASRTVYQLPGWTRPAELPQK